MFNGTTKEIIFPSSLYSSPSSINNLLRQFNSLSIHDDNVIFDTSNIKWIDSEVSAFIGALIENLKIRQPTTKLFLKHNTSPSRSEELLSKNNFLNHYLDKNLYDYNSTGYTVKYDVLTVTRNALTKNDLTNIYAYLNNELFSHSKWGANFETYKNQLGFSESIFELARNTSDHSRSENLIFAGQYYPTKNQFRLSIADNGLGIPLTVRAGSNATGSDAELINWAVQKGNTSKSNNHARGMGLATIAKSLQNVGELTIISGNGHWKQIDNGTVELTTLSHKFAGTYVRITFLNDKINNNSFSSEESFSANLPF
ncbi:hypothetical protein [Weissella confusa]|uniref:hypothetical protein n=1 Tax=Weissella confusa TaxID=1583 RepID=UPI001896A6EC|nr:hypothetical protein [Weissella confusa]